MNYFHSSVFVKQMPYIWQIYQVHIEFYRLFSVYTTVDKLLQQMRHWQKIKNTASQKITL